MAIYDGDDGDADDADDGDDKLRMIVMVNDA